MTIASMLKKFQKGNETCLQFKVHSMESGACSTAHRSNRPGHSDSLVLDRSAVGQLSSVSGVLHLRISLLCTRIFKLVS